MYCYPRLLPDTKGFEIVVFQTSNHVINIQVIVTSAKEAMFSLWLVCLSDFDQVCAKCTGTISMNLGGRV